MSELISRAKLSILLWWSVISYVALFTIQSLCTAVIGAVTGKVWENLTRTEKIIITCTIVAQWSTTMLAFLNSAINTIKKAEDKPESTPILPPA